MSTVRSIEIGFNNHIREINKCTTVKQLVAACTYKGIQEYSLKFFNKRFRGDFNKSKQYVIEEANKGYNNALESFYESEMDGFYDDQIYGSLDEEIDTISRM